MSQRLPDSLLGSDDSCHDAASLARAVEFAEKDILPGGEAQYAINQGDRFTGAHQA